MGGFFETLSGAKGVRAEGKSAQNISEFNAQVQKREAQAQRQQATFAQRRQARAGVEAKSALTAQLATAGGLDSPVAGDLAAEQASELELENLLIGFEGEVAARKSESQATLDRLQGRLLRQKGKSAARRASVQFGVQGASLLVGFSGGGKKGGSSGGKKGGSSGGK